MSMSVNSGLEASNSFSSEAKRFHQDVAGEASFSQELITLPDQDLSSCFACFNIPYIEITGLDAYRLLQRKMNALGAQPLISKELKMIKKLKEPAFFSKFKITKTQFHTMLPILKKTAENELLEGKIFTMKREEVVEERFLLFMEAVILKIAQNDLSQKYKISVAKVAYSVKWIAQTLNQYKARGEDAAFLPIMGYKGVEKWQGKPQH